MEAHVGKFAFRAEDLRNKAKWHVARAGSGGSHAKADLYEKSAQDRDEINEHRKATGRRKFGPLTNDQVHKHLGLIEEHAPYGDDPWGKHRNTTDPKFGSND